MLTFKESQAAAEHHDKPLFFDSGVHIYIKEKWTGRSTKNMSIKGILW